MRPGQLQPNEFEMAILRQFAQQEPALQPHIQQLHVLSRQFTGVGCFTRFQYDGADPERVVGLDAQIHVPDVPNGLGSVLFCRGDHPECLELYTFGNEHWDGTFEGYSITTPNQALQPTTGRRDART